MAVNGAVARGIAKDAMARRIADDHPPAKHAVDAMVIASRRSTVLIGWPRPPSGQPCCSLMMVGPGRTCRNLPRYKPFGNNAPLLLSYRTVIKRKADPNGLSERGCGEIGCSQT